jgi:hypothetical protein
MTPTTDLMLPALAITGKLTRGKIFIDFHGCGFSPRFSRASGSRGTNHRLQASRPLGGGLIRRKAFQAGVYPPPAQPTGFSR